MNVGSAPIPTSTSCEKLGEALRVSNSELEEFAYVASHDLKEPLRTVSVYSQLLSRRLQNQIDAETNLHLGYILKAAQRMIDLIEDLLGYSRVVYSERLDDQSADLNLSFQLAASALEEQILATGAVLTVPDLPVTSGEEVQYGMVFQNLLSNSLKYHQPGDVPRISVTAEPLGGEWLISVSDNGMGFNQSYAERIFGLFQRLHDRTYPGTGLGLAICRRIVERYGGRIWALFGSGQGSYLHLFGQGRAAIADATATARVLACVLASILACDLSMYCQKMVRVRPCTKVNP